MFLFQYYFVLILSVGVPSEVTLVHNDDLLWFINCDETDHKFSTEGPKVGVKALCYHNPSFPRTGNRIVKSSRHTTGVYATNPLEPLPPLYIFDTKSKSESNYNIDPAWCQGLPKVRGKYGTGRMMTYNSFVAMRPKGGMDKSLFPMYIEKDILPLYPTVQRDTVRDPKTGRKLKGPLFIKTDTGPGCLSQDEEHVRFRENLEKQGVDISLGLPNGTECTQEMDQGFQEYKPATDASTVRVAAKKMAARVLARKKFRAKMQQNGNQKQSAKIVNAIESESAIEDLNEYLAEGEADDIDEEDNFSFEVQGSTCNVKIDNNDLSAIVNGFPDDPIELRPFDKIFNSTNIWKWWCKVGFITMNQNALYDDKVRQQLGGEKAAVGDYGKRLKILAQDYEMAANEVTEMGFNGEILDLEMEVVQPQQNIDNEDELVNKLVAENAVTSTGRLYRLGIQIANSKIVTKAARRQIEIKNEKKAAQLETKNQKELFVKSEAANAFEKFQKAGKSAVSSKDTKAILKFILPLLAPNEKMSSYNTGPKAMSRLEQFAIDLGNKIRWESKMKRFMKEDEEVQEGQL